MSLKVPPELELYDQAKAAAARAVLSVRKWARAAFQRSRTGGGTEAAAGVELAVAMTRSAASRAAPAIAELEVSPT